MITVLYVDDEAGLLEITKLFLEKDGEFAVATAVSAQEALDTSAIPSYDAIISDYQMPGMDGIGFLKAVRQQFGDIPFILFTGRGREEIVIDAINNGADFYLQKGGDPRAQFAELAHKIRQAVRRKKAERSLFDSERRLADIISFLPDATFAIDCSGRVIAWNRAMEEMTGVPAAEILGQGEYAYAIPFYHERRPILIDLVLHDDPVTAAKYPSISRKGTTLYSEIALPHLNNGGGAVLWFTASPLYDSRGTRAGAIESIREITGRKRAEEALQESEERYRNVVEVQTELISRFRPDGTHVFVNEAYCRYFNLSRADILGHVFRPRIFHEDRDRVRQFFASLNPDHPSATIEHRIIMPDGTLRWQRWSDHAIFDAAGAVTEYQSVGEDITSRRLEEQALHENEQRLASIYNTVGDVIFQLTVEPHEQYRFTSINPAFSRTTGIPAENIIGRLVTEVIPEPSLTVAREKYRQAIQEKTIVRWEETSVYPSGQLIGEVSIAPIFDRQEHCTHLIGSVHDITERKRTEEEILSKNILLSTQQETSPDGILIVDEEGMILNYNRKFLEIWGIPEDLMASGVDGPVLRYVAKKVADPGAFESRVNYLYAHKEKESFEELLLSDGRVLERFSSPMLGEEGKYYGRVWYFRDITRRKRAEDALRKNQQQLKDAMDLTGLACWEYDYTGKMFTFDDRFFAMVKTSTEREGSGRMTVEKYTREFIHPDDAHAVADEIAKAMRSCDPDYVSRREHRLVCRDGGIHTVLTLIRVTRDADRLPVRVHGTIQDITERKRAEEALRENEQKYRTLIDKASEGVLIVQDGILVFANRSACGLLQRPHGDLVGKSFGELIWPEDRDCVVTRHRQRLGGEDVPDAYDFRILSTDGSPRWVFLSAARIVWQGRPATLNLMTDITGRKQVEEALKQAEEKFSTIFRQSPDIIWISELDSGRFVDANDATKRILGYSRQELVGKTSLELGIWVNPQDRETLMRRVRSEGRVDRFGTKHHHKNGEAIDVESSASTIILGGREYLIISIRDISELRRAEAALRTSEAFYRSFLSASPDGVVITDLQGTILIASPSALTIFGFSRNESLDRRIFEFLVPEDRKRAATVILQMQKEGFSGPGEYRATRAEGRVIDIEVNGELVRDAGGNAAGMVFIVRDSTERRRNEKAVREANRKLSLLSGITRHDIGNQLAILQGHLALAIMKGTDPALADQFRMMNTSASRIASMIQLTKEYEEIGVAAPAWQDARLLVDAAAQQAPVGAIVVRNDIPAGTELFADPLIARVFYNMLDNAARYGGGAITTVRFSVSTTENCCRILCEDDGTGILSGEKDHIFERGFGKNTGMGLYLSREILGITGITIAETGEPGRGARFEIAVPDGMWRLAGKV